MTDTPETEARVDWRAGGRRFAPAVGVTCVLVGAAYLVSWGLVERLLDVISASILAVTGGQGLVRISPDEVFGLYTSLAGFSALVVSSPLVVGIWLFVVGRRTLADAARATLLAGMFCGVGVLFGWFVGFPLMARSMVTSGAGEPLPVTDLFRAFFGIVGGMAFAFQIPAIAYGMSRRPSSGDEGAGSESEDTPQSAEAPENANEGQGPASPIA
jgi:Sec-independent protein secretion pathway component TatC